MKMGFPKNPQGTDEALAKFENLSWHEAMEGQETIDVSIGRLADGLHAYAQAKESKEIKEASVTLEQVQVDDDASLIPKAIKSKPRTRSKSMNNMEAVAFDKG